MDKIVRAIFGVISTLLLGFLLTNGLIEFYNIAWGVGDWLGEFSLKWGLAFFAYHFQLVCFNSLFFSNLGAGKFGKMEKKIGCIPTANRDLSMANRFNSPFFGTIIVPIYAVGSGFH